MKIFVFTLFIFFTISLRAQFAPQAGADGTTAIYKDSSIINYCATNCEISRGFVNIADTSLGLASYGENSSAIGNADNIVVSLGDSGSAILSFDIAITNGDGADFAIFENSFSDFFLELAFVEVSTDGRNYVRFPSISLTQDSLQVASFGEINPQDINNLAGKYRGGFGTPFDLSDLPENDSVNIDSINFIKIIDVVGTIDTLFASYDSQGNIINDPYPTSFNSSGFDLDAVGIINYRLKNDINNIVKENDINVYYNSINQNLYINNNISEVYIFNVMGVLNKYFENANICNLSNLNTGVYIAKIVSKNSIKTYKFLK